MTPAWEFLADVHSDVKANNMLSAALLDRTSPEAP